VGRLPSGVAPRFFSQTEGAAARRFWGLGGGAQFSSPARREAAKNPGQKARSRKPEYKIPAWSAPPVRILAAAIVERLPVVTPDPEPWETAMWDLQERKSLALQKPLPDDWFRGEFSLAKFSACIPQRSTVVDVVHLSVHLWGRITHHVVLSCCLAGAGMRALAFAGDARAQLLTPQDLVRGAVCLPVVGVGRLYRACIDSNLTSAGGTSPIAIAQLPLAALGVCWRAWRARIWRLKLLLCIDGR